MLIYVALGLAIGGTVMPFILAWAGKVLAEAIAEEFDRAFSEIRALRERVEVLESREYELARVPSGWVVKTVPGEVVEVDEG